MAVKDAEDKKYGRSMVTSDDGIFEISFISGGCDERVLVFSKENYEVKEITFPNGSYDTVFIEPMHKTHQLFNQSEPFEILSTRKLNEYDANEKGINECEGWRLSRGELNQIIQESESISNYDLHYLFGQYPCEIQGKLRQNTEEFDFSLNSGAWFTVSSKDTSQLFGSFTSGNNHLFLDSVWTHQDE